MVMRKIMMRTVWTQIKYIPDTYDFMLVQYVEYTVL